MILNGAVTGVKKNDFFWRFAVKLNKLKNKYKNCSFETNRMTKIHGDLKRITIFPTCLKVWGGNRHLEVKEECIQDGGADMSTTSHFQTFLQMSYFYQNTLKFFNSVSFGWTMFWRYFSYFSIQFLLRFSGPKFCKISRWPCRIAIHLALLTIYKY